MSVETTADTLLGGRVRLDQPAHGYRVAIDPVLLAAAAPARAGERVLDLGTGVGAAMLCAASRVAGCAFVGIELDTDLVAIARANVAANRMGNRVTVLAGDVAVPPEATGSSFDHVLANPPYGEAGRGSASPLAAKRRANFEGEADLRTWVCTAFRVLADGGSATFVHRADRAAELAARFAEAGAGGVVLFPLWPKAGGDAKRVIVQGRKGGRGPLRFAPGLVLHEADGRYTAAAQAVLRFGEALTL
jgi:tRNA1(Val) A37 N6-methylase TrmN6